MDIIFTICSNNYLAQATVLGRSIRNHQPLVKFLIFLCDEVISFVDYQDIADEIIPIKQIEPRMQELEQKFNIIELNTAVKPRIFEYLFIERKAEKVIYLDPDIKVFDSLNELFDDLNSFNILLTPHIFQPIPNDGKKPTEALFQNFGLYNLGFLALRNTAESLRLVNWWKDCTYINGFIDVCNGRFVDQLPMNHVPLFFQGVKIIGDMGCNMAPWNIQERRLSTSDGGYIVNENMRLKFFHFTSFSPDSNELPLFHYDRFLLKDRSDLHAIYAEYNNELKAAGYYFYKQIRPFMKEFAVST